MARNIGKWNAGKCTCPGHDQQIETRGQPGQLGARRLAEPAADSVAIDGELRDFLGHGEADAARLGWVQPRGEAEQQRPARHCLPDTKKPINFGFSSQTKSFVEHAGSLAWRLDG